MNTADFQIPKEIWILWLQGWDKAPEIARVCLKSWQAHNPGWKINALSEHDVGALLPSDLLLADVLPKALQPEALSDAIRIALLQKFGGVWADSTVLCLKPLDAWLPDHAPKGFFAFAKPTPDRMVASWLLAASSGNRLVAEWQRLVRDYWSQRTARDQYFWFHYLFAAGYIEDAAFQAIWHATPKIPASGPLRFWSQEKLRERLTEEGRAVIEQASVPVLKLTHHLWGRPPPDSVLRYILARP